MFARQLILEVSRLRFSSSSLLVPCKRQSPPRSRLKVDETDSYDQQTFGLLMIAVNCLGLAMVLVGWLTKPITRLENALSKTHVHNAPLKGIGKEHQDLDLFKAHFDFLTTSSVEEAGWEVMTVEDWGGKGSQTFLDETGPVGSWRSECGKGPIDQCRVVFDVEALLEDVF